MLQIKRLDVVGLRAYSQAEFRFQSGMNLLVGINGVGKTTVLEALRICLSNILSESTLAKIKKESFSLSDIRIGEERLQITCEFGFDESPFNLTIVKNKEQYIPKDSGNPRDQVKEQIDREEITPPLPRILTRFQNHQSQPIGIYFSTKRSLISEKAPSKTAAVGGQAAAYVDALSADREFNLRIFAEWFRAQQVLGKENPVALKNIGVLREAVMTFLPGFRDLDVIEEDEKATFIIRKLGNHLKHTQLSDGERGVLSIVIDIARRLIQANPIVEEPLKCNAVILIDELDLHLHPKWQRTIVDNLTRVFPNCQFIATTHSPQIIPTLEPENIQLIKGNEVIRPIRSLGMDSNWILKNLMEDEERPKEAGEAIEKVEKAIKEINFEDARELMSTFKNQGFNLPEWATLEARIARLEMLSEE